MLLPITLPTATSAEPENVAWRLTPNSGALVPKATTVKPTIKGGTRIAAASADAPRTKNSPPPTSTTKPATIINTGMTYSDKKLSRWQKAIDRGRLTRFRQQATASNHRVSRASSWHRATLPTVGCRPNDPQSGDPGQSHPAGAAAGEMPPNRHRLAAQEMPM